MRKGRDIDWVGAKRGGMVTGGSGCVGQERVVTAGEHTGGKMAHDGFGLDVQVSEHLVRLPAAQESDTVRIHVSAQEGHRASGAEGPGRDILG
jgi:hypothetical protein